MRRLGVMLLPLLVAGCQDLAPVREARVCDSVEAILASPLVCDGQRVSIVGYLTFTRHGIYIADDEDGDAVLAVGLSTEKEHSTGTSELIAWVRSLPPATTRTLFGRFEGMPVVAPGEKPKLEVFSGMELPDGGD